MRSEHIDTSVVPEGEEERMKGDVEVGVEEETRKLDM